MEKEEFSVKEAEEDVSILNHLIMAIDESEKKLEEFYKIGDVEGVNKTKKFMINLNKRISDLLG